MGSADEFLAGLGIAADAGADRRTDEVVNGSAPGVDSNRLYHLEQRIGELAAEASGERFTARSDDGAVVAVVDGHGAVLDLQIAREALVGPRPEQMGPVVVTAVNRARRQASVTSSSKIDRLLEGA